MGHAFLAFHRGLELDRSWIGVGLESDWRGGGLERGDEWGEGVSGARG
jgi:hypothetical protein